jgi:hypothetical protein
MVVSYAGCNRRNRFDKCGGGGMHSDVISH